MNHGEMMKIILSRKGFDSQYGGQPSPILQDGTLLSLPIPSKRDQNKFSEIMHDGVSYYQIIKELKANTKINEHYNCHLDPDIRNINGQIKTFGLFGQTGAALGHLNKNGIGINDIFLFYGSFRETENINGKLRYKQNSHEKHVIYGYLQIGQIFKDMNCLPNNIEHHPHSAYKDDLNYIYVSSNEFSLIEGKPGFGVLQYKPSLVLTKENESKSKWALPDFFRDVNITYHKQSSFKDSYFQSAAKGQEFIIDGSKEIINWVINLIH